MCHEVNVFLSAEFEEFVLGKIAKSDELDYADCVLEAMVKAKRLTDGARLGSLLDGSLQFQEYVWSLEC